MNEGGISSGTKTLMMFVAVTVDLFQIGINLFPFVGPIIGILFNPAVSIGALVVFYLWFKMNGVDIYGSRNSGATLANMVIEIMPGFDIFTSWTIWVAYTIWRGRRAEGGV